MCNVVLVLSEVFGAKTEEIIGSWRKLDNEELHNLYSSRNNIRLIKPIRMRWAGHVAQNFSLKT
jgi:hypothetical protein